MLCGLINEACNRRALGLYIFFFDFLFIFFFNTNLHKNAAAFTFKLLHLSRNFQRLTDNTHTHTCSETPFNYLPNAAAWPFTHTHSRTHMRDTKEFSGNLLKIGKPKWQRAERKEEAEEAGEYEVANIDINHLKQLPHTHTWHPHDMFHSSTHRAKAVRGDGGTCAAIKQSFWSLWRLHSIHHHYKRL